MSIESSLKERLERIFDLKKVTFSRPSDSREQDYLFIEVESTRMSVKWGREVARVRGKCHIFTQADKCPIGFISKRIALADRDDTKDLFFFELEEAALYFGNLVERSFSFVFFFDGQFNPDAGTITSITLSEGES